MHAAKRIDTQGCNFTDNQQDNVSSFENANSHTKIADWRHDAR